jgi:hypothetical protein
MLAAVKAINVADREVADREVADREVAVVVEVVADEW